MPTEAKSDEKFKESLKEKTVPLDTSGQGAEVTIPEEKDPSETGFENLLYLINVTEKTKFSDLMRLKLNGKTKKHMEILR